MNVLTKTETTALAPISESELMKVLQSSLYPGASADSINMVRGYCKAAGLDVMQKPLHIVPMWDSKAGAMRDVVMPGINLYRTQAMRSGECAGVSEPEFGPDITDRVGGQEITFPAWCRVTVKRRLPTGEIVDFAAREFWRENYAVKGGKEKSIAPNAMWTKRPYGQIAKCAEAQALRKAFPEIASQPTADEMEGKPMHADDMQPRNMGAADVVNSWTPELLAAGKEAATKGTKGYGDFWKSVVPTEIRTMLVNTPEHANFKNEAVAADKARTVETPAPAAPVVTFDVVMQKLTSAANLDALYVAGDWIGGVADPEQRATLTAKFDELQQGFGG